VANQIGFVSGISVLPRSASILVGACCLFFGSHVLAQQSAAPVESAAHQAGMFEAFRTCLKQDRQAGLISEAVYQRCDATADRLYFGLYNSHYKGPHSPLSQGFVNEAQKIVNDVIAHPGLCKGDADFNKVSAAVTQDARGFYGDHPQLVCTPCECAVPNLSSPALTPVQPFQAQKLPDLHHLVVYPDYCLGQVMQGIMFLPQDTAIAAAAGTPENTPPQMCEAKDVHIRQFISSTCAIPGKCDDTLATTCGVRKLGAWYLDECPDPAPHHLFPDSAAADSTPHVIADEPTPNVPSLPDYPALIRTFHDVVMCGDTTVLEALTWTRTGAHAPQWCVNKAGNPKVTGGAPYSKISAEDPKSEAVRTAVCGATNTRDLSGDKGIEAIVANFGGCPKTN